MIKLFLTRKTNPINTSIFKTLGNELNESVLKKIFMNNDNAKNIISQKIGSFKNCLSFLSKILLTKIRNNTMKNKLIKKLPSKKQRGPSDIKNNDISLLSLIELFRVLVNKVIKLVIRGRI